MKSLKFLLVVCQFCLFLFDENRLPTLALEDVAVNINEKLTWREIAASIEVFFFWMVVDL